MVNAQVLRLVLIAVCCAFASCAQEKPDDLLQSARKFSAANDPASAIIQLKRALQVSPDLADGRALLGQAFLETGDPISAETELRKALALKSPESDVLPALARAMNQSGQHKKLLSQYADVHLSTPAAEADVRTSMATAYSRLGSQPQSDSAIAAALASVPEYPPARRFQAVLFATQAKFDESIALLDKLLAGAPNDHEALSLKGNILFYGKGDVASAKEAQKKALVIRPDFWPARASLLTIDLAKGDLADAQAELAEIKRLKPAQLQTKLLEAEVAYAKQDYKAVKDLTQQILKAAPDHAGSLGLAGAAAYKSGALLQAERLLSKSLQNSGQASTRKMLAQTYLKAGNAARAIETLGPLLRADVVDPEALAVAGEAHLQSGDVNAAEGMFKRASKASPDNPKIQLALAMTEIFRGHVAEGNQALQRLAVLDKGTSADLALINSYFRVAQYDEALVAIASLEKKDPTSPIAAELRGRVALVRKDPTSARNSFERALAISPTYFPSASKLAALDVADHKPDAAKSRFDALLKVDPKNPQALLALAELRSKAGASSAEVESALRDAVRLNPSDASPRLALMAHLASLGDTKGALAAATDAATAIAENSAILDALGRAQLAAGDFNQAASSFNRLADLEPRSPLPLLRLADVHVASKNATGARQALKRALALSPNLLAAQRGLVVVELTDARPQEALEVARTIQKTPPNQAIGSMFVGEVHESQKRWADAIAAYRLGLKVGPTSQIAIKLHGVLIKSGAAADAERFSDEWLHAHSGDPVFALYLGERALAQSDLPAAEARYSAVLKVHPTNAVANNNLAWTLAKANKPGALGYAEKANELIPNQPAFMDTLSMILADAKQLDRAIDLERRAVDLQPQVAIYRLNLARLYVSAGKKAQARTELDQLTRLGDKFSGQAEVGKLLNTL